MNTQQIQVMVDNLIDSVIGRFKVTQYSKDCNFQFNVTDIAPDRRRTTSKLEKLVKDYMEARGFTCNVKEGQVFCSTSVQKAVFNHNQALAYCSCFLPGLPGIHWKSPTDVVQKALEFAIKAKFKQQFSNPSTYQHSN